MIIFLTNMVSAAKQSITVNNPGYGFRQEAYLSWSGASDSYWKIEGQYYNDENIDGDNVTVSGQIYCDGAWRSVADSNYVSSYSLPQVVAAWPKFYVITAKGKNCSQLKLTARIEDGFEGFRNVSGTRYYEDIKRDASVSTPSLTYNGYPQTGVTGSNVSLSGTTSATNAGTYTAYATPTNGHAWSDGTRSTKTITWTISRAKSASAYAANKTYNGYSQTGVDGSYVSWSGKISATDAGTYTAYATPTSNYAWSNGGTEQRKITWTMNKKDLSGTLTVGVNTSGVASWNGITGAANYTVKIGGSTINTTTSTQYNLNSSLLSSAGSKTVTIVANPSSNYNGTVSGSSGVNIYTLTFVDKGGTYSSRYISGSTATIRTPASATGYTFQYWKRIR